MVEIRRCVYCNEDILGYSWCEWRGAHYHEDCLYWVTFLKSGHGWWRRRRVERFRVELIAPDSYPEGRIPRFGEGQE